MLKQTITYKGFDGEELTDTLYFNLNRMDLAELTARHGGVDMEAKLTEIQEKKDIGSFYAFLKDVVLSAYGEKSEDGKRFIKNDEIRDRFAESLAFAELIEVFHEGEGQKMEQFITGILSQIRGLKEAAK